MISDTVSASAIDLDVCTLANVRRTRIDTPPVGPTSDPPAERSLGEPGLIANAHRTRLH